MNDKLRPMVFGLAPRVTITDNVELAAEVAEEDADYPIPSEKMTTELARKMSRSELLANLRLVRDLILDKDEDIAEEDREYLTEAYNANLEELRRQGQETSLVSLTTEDIEEFYNRHHSTEDGKFISGTGTGGGSRAAKSKAAEKKPPGDLYKRFKSLTPRGLKETWYKKGSSIQNEYNHGRYNYNYRPKTLKEAKHKKLKTNLSRARWFAAAVILSPTAIVPGVKKGFTGVVRVAKEKNDIHRTAKRQYRALKSVGM